MWIGTHAIVLARLWLLADVLTVGYAYLIFGREAARKRLAGQPVSPFHSRIIIATLILSSIGFAVMGIAHRPFR